MPATPEPVHEASPSEPAAEKLDVSVVMPCLNEAATVGTCIEKVHKGLEGSSLRYEIIVGDNGSTDGSQDIAEQAGARVVPIDERGYGHALRGAIQAARGRTVVMADADDTYDFLQVGEFVAKLDEGFDLVMGSRFRGKIYPGAMPKLHRYLGNPMLTWILNVLFKAGVSDAHCGLRGFTRDAFERMNLKTGGMEFASEMVIRSAQQGMRIAEIPTTLRPDRRDRPPHLRSFRDGWRHLRFMLMFSPSWLFILPGVVMGILGLLLVALIPFVDLTFFAHRFDIHFGILGVILTVLGLTVVQFGCFAKVVFVGKGLGEDRLGRWFVEKYRMNAFLVIGLLIALVGVLGNATVLYYWADIGFGPLSKTVTAQVLLASTAMIVGLQVLFAAFFLGILRASYTDVWVD